MLIRTAHVIYLKEKKPQATINLNMKFIKSKFIIVKTATKNYLTRNSNKLI